MNNKFIMGAIIGAAAMYLLTNMGKGQSTDTPIKVPPIKKQPLPDAGPPVITAGGNNTPRIRGKVYRAPVPFRSTGNRLVA
jgi:hypothetical protein